MCHGQDQEQRHLRTVQGSFHLQHNAVGQHGPCMVSSVTLECTTIETNTICKIRIHRTEPAWYHDESVS